MTTNRDEEKRLAAQRALGYVEQGSIIGVGTGSTVAHFIDALGAVRGRIDVPYRVRIKAPRDSSNTASA